VSTNLKTEPITTAHKIAKPNWLPAKLAVAKSPAPTPVAAMRIPGRMIANRLGRLFFIMVFNMSGFPKKKKRYGTSILFRDGIDDEYDTHLAPEYQIVWYR